MKINFKNPKYLYPIVILPFLCLFFYLYTDSVKGKEQVVVEEGSQGLQDDLGEVSEKVKERGLADKLHAYTDRYKNSNSVSAIKAIERNERDPVGRIYDDQRMLDSLEKEFTRQYGDPGSTEQLQTSYWDYTPHASPDQGLSAEDRALAEFLNGQSGEAPFPATSAPAGNSALPASGDPLSPMELFKQQMTMIDSMQKAGDPDYQAKKAEEERQARQQKQLASKPKLGVVKAGSEAEVFNRITADEEEDFIKAIIDEEVTGYAGSRIRLRLLEDISAGGHLVEKGTYLYATITGFSQQRVTLSVRSILQKGKILPVSLDIYDIDGLPGLYVPASAFREFSKELGSSSMQGVNLQTSPEDNSQFIMSTMQRAFQSTSSALARLVRKNKAKLKYSTYIYLIDPEELEKAQQQY